MSSSPTPDFPVAVIGGGVVGAAVAQALARRGTGSILLEAEEELALGAVLGDVVEEAGGGQALTLKERIQVADGPAGRCRRAAPSDQVTRTLTRPA